MMKKMLFLGGALSIFILMIAGCETFAAIGNDPVTKAVAVVRPLNGSDVSGIVTFVQEGRGVRVIAELTGLASGKHGFHIHEYGDIRTVDGSSAGGHLNPGNAIHGGPDDKARHIGDLGNIEADRSGNAKYNRVDAKISLNGPNSIIGRSIVIKANVDDYKTQPGGNAGMRIGMGVIGTSVTPVE